MLNSKGKHRFNERCFPKRRTSSRSPSARAAMRMGQQKELGFVTLIQADHGLADSQGWRIQKALAGGGPLMDVGIYCVQAARYVTGTEPVAVTAQEGHKRHPEKFMDVEESITWQMEMPHGIIVKCSSSYTEKTNRLLIKAEKGWMELSPAYAYTGIKGRTIDASMDLPQVNHQALQMDDFALCIKEGRPSPVSGGEGRKDVKILQAIYKAMETRERVEIKGDE